MLKLEKLTLQKALPQSCDKFGDHPAMSLIGQKAFSYTELKAKVDTFSAALLKWGIKKGDKIAIISENSPLWGMAYMAIGQIGATNAPVLTDFHKNEVHHIIRSSEARIALTSKKFAHKLENGKLGNLELIITLDDAEIVNEAIKTQKLSDFLAENTSEVDPKKFPEVDEEDLLEILFTSGTTGHSKGVMLTNKNIISNALEVLEAIDIGTSDRLLSILPLAHVYECTCGMIAPLLGGANITYIVGLPTAQTLMPAMAKINPTIVLSVPLVMEKIYKKRVVSEVNGKPVLKALYKIPPIRKALNKIIGKKLYQAFGGALRFIVFGGAATPPEVENFLKEGKFPYISGYGLTETSPLLTVNPPEKVKVGSCGKPVRDVELRIDDINPQSGAGEILARGPMIMKGYYKNPEATAEVMLEGGWFKTGDLGYLDDEGYLHISGRSKNVIVGPSGENIFPELIEHVIGENPFVLESLVYQYEGKLVARVFLDYDAVDAQFETQKMTETEAKKKIQDLLEQIRRETNNSVASFSRITKIIEQQEEFEKTPTKKIKRFLYYDKQI